MSTETNTAAPPLTANARQLAPQRDRERADPSEHARHARGAKAKNQRAPEKQEQKREPHQAYLAGLMKPAVTYFPAEQYHRRQGLNCCVRDGNRCFPLSMFTGKSFGGFSAAEGVFA